MAIAGSSSIECLRELSDCDRVCGKAEVAASCRLMFRRRSNFSKLSFRAIELLLPEGCIVWD